MSDLSQIITVTISRNTTTPTQTGFGTPLLVGYFPTSVFAERVRTYTTLAGLEADGFSTIDPIHKMASDLLAQNPSPTSFKVGRRAGAPQQVFTFTPTDFTVGAIYAIKVTATDSATYASRAATIDYATYTVQASDTATLVCDGLRTSLTPTGDYTEGGTATLTLTANNTHATVDGQVFGVECAAGTPTSAAGTAFATVELPVTDSTPDPAVGIATDLAAIALYDNDWYGLCIDSNSHAEIDAAVVWVDTVSKLFVCQTQDEDVSTVAVASDTTSVAAGLVSTNTDRTQLFYHRNNYDFICAAMLGRILPELAGASTWAYKQLSSVASQTLTATETTNLEAKDVNFLTTLAGVAVTRYGTASGAEYMDIMRGADWLQARIEERIYTLLINNDKLPYTDGGIAAVRGEILAQLQQGVDRGFLAADPAPTCTVPLAAAVSAADKGTRTLNDVTFRATLAGAIHKTTIAGELNL